MDSDFGRYLILHEQARGAHGVVYRARDLELDREVALKVLRSEDADPEDRERFFREARLAGRLDHPNVVRVFEVGEFHGRPYYTMAFLEGEPLRGPLPPEEACRLAARIARAVAHAHSQGIVHRDLKPGNILVCSGEPIVTDFGVARALRDPRTTATGEVLGTPCYMAPEQMRGRPDEVGPESDVYALGVIFFELLTGQLPYEAPSFLELSAKVLGDPLPALPGCDPRLQGLVLRCLDKSPRGRPSAAEVAALLESIGAPARRRRWAVPAFVAASVAAVLLWSGSGPSVDASGEMARVPAGAYEVGDPRFSRRTVTVGEFWIDRDEAPARANGYSYRDALGYCLRSGKRLPTEDEWDVASGGRLFPWGDEADFSRASCTGKRGSNPLDASPFGVRDLAGNLAEWTATPGRTGADTRVVRGGHWQAPPEDCTAYAREEIPLSRRLVVLGVRCARSGRP